MAKTIESDNQGDLFGRGTEITEYVPCVEPPVAEMDEQFFADRLMDIHREAMNPNSTMHPSKLSVAGKQIETLMKMRGLLTPKKIDVNVKTETYEDLLKKAQNK